MCDFPVPSDTSSSVCAHTSLCVYVSVLCVLLNELPGRSRPPAVLNQIRLLLSNCPHHTPGMNSDHMVTEESRKVATMRPTHAIFCSSERLHGNMSWCVQGHTGHKYNCILNNNLSPCCCCVFVCLCLFCTCGEESKPYGKTYHWNHGSKVICQFERASCIDSLLLSVCVCVCVYVRAMIANPHRSPLTAYIHTVSITKGRTQTGG